jgi:thiamine pyrophosphate-dependent acetolactate synthase large subunit-like protein
VATGDGAFLMNSQEIETALRMRLPLVVLIWVDDAYGLISWKMDMEIGHSVDTELIRSLGDLDESLSRALSSQLREQVGEAPHTGGLGRHLDAVDGSEGGARA